MSKQADLLAEIARMDFEVQRLGRELDTLRRRIEGTTRSGRTQTFAAAEPISVRPSSAPMSAPAPTKPKPSNAPTTSIRTIPPEAQSRPSADPRAVRSEQVTSARRVASPGLRSDDIPAPASRRDSQPREVGRYEYVAEGKPRPASRRS